MNVRLIRPILFIRYNMSCSPEHIFKNGTYYNPATKHYDFQGIVNCDRCHRKNISVCIGYKDSDLCMRCVSYIEEKIAEEKINNSIRPLSEGRYEDPSTMTLMMSSDYADKLTFMRSSDYGSYDPMMQTRMMSSDYGSYPKVTTNMKNHSYNFKTKMMERDYKPLSRQTKMRSKNYNSGSN